MQALQRIDLILREAGKHGVRLLLTLSNFEPFLGGWQWWVDQVTAGALFSSPIPALGTGI